MKFTALFSSILFTAVLILCISCSGCKVKEEQKEQEIIATSTNDQNLPYKWPWRGIAITSAHAESKHINFSYLKSIHVNHVSLAYMPAAHARNYKLDLEECIKGDIQWLHQMLDSCVKYDLAALITYQEYPIALNTDFKQSSAKLWENETELEKAMTIIKSLVTKFRSRGKELAAYEFFCEPVIAEPGVRARRPDVWPEYAQRICDEVRKIDSERYIVVNPGPWGNPLGYRDWQPVNADRIIYGTHMYQPNPYTTQRKPKADASYPGTINSKQWSRQEIRNVFDHVENFKAKHEALIYVGEFSAAPWATGYDHYLKDCISVFEELGYSYNYWNLNGWPIWNANYDVGFEDKRNGAGDAGLDSPKWQILKEAFQNNKEQQ